MPLYNLYANVSLWFRKHLWVIAGVTLFSAAVGFGTDRLVGGRTAEVAGRVQFIFLVMYFLLAFIFYIFRPYQGRVGTVLRSVPAVNRSSVGQYHLGVGDLHDRIYCAFHCARRRLTIGSSDRGVESSVGQGGKSMIGINQLRFASAQPRVAQPHR
jgi:hypothetical protein